MANWKKLIVSGSLGEFSGVVASDLTNNNLVIAGPDGRLEDSGITLSGGILDIGSNSIQSTGPNSILTGSFSGSFTGDGSGLSGIGGNLNFTGESGNGSVNLDSQTFSIDAGEGIDTVALNQTITISGEDASTTNKGIAKFNNSFFTVSSGNVSIKSQAITPTELNTSVAGDGLSGGNGSPLSVDYGSNNNTAVEGNTTMDFSGTPNEITIDSGATQTLGNPSGVTIGLADTIAGDRTFQDNILVNGNFIVEGTASFQESQNTTIADRYILLASGSSAAGSGGIVVQQATQNIGEVLTWDNTSSRWGVASSFDASNNSVTPDAFMASVLTGNATDNTSINSLVDNRYEAKGNIFVGDNEDIWIYS